MPYINGLLTISKNKVFYSKNQSNEPFFLLCHSTIEDKDFMNVSKNKKKTQKPAKTVKQAKPAKPVETEGLFEVLSKLPELENENIVIDNEDFNNKKYKILIVEDNPVNMVLIKSILIQLLPKASITKVMNGKDAVKYCKKSTPDIIFMDLLMPEMNGYETTIKIRSQNKCKKIPIIAVSAGNLKEVKEKSANSGINDFIVKPINEKSLIKIINKWLISENKSENVFTEPEDAEETNDNTNSELNKETLLAFITNDPEVASELFEVAKTELHSSCNKLLKHAKNKNKELLKEDVHKLIGTAGSLGLEVMAAKVGSLMSQDNYASKEFVSNTEEICSSLDNLLVLMENEINKLK